MDTDGMKRANRLLGYVLVLLLVQIVLSGAILLNLNSATASAKVSAEKPGVTSVESRPASPVVVNVSTGAAYIKGSPEAPVTIVEFSDFECPYCQKAIPVINEIMKHYEGKVKLAFRHLPVPGHDHAYIAALAAEAAGEQGKFWEMHDTLFAKASTSGPGALSKEQLIAYAAALNLDVTTFTKAIETEKYKAKIIKDVTDSRTYEIEGTPTFFINGRKVAGALSYSDYSAIIDEALSRASATR